MLRLPSLSSDGVCCKPHEATLASSASWLAFFLPVLTAGNFPVAAGCVSDWLNVWLNGCLADLKGPFRPKAAAKCPQLTVIGRLRALLKKGCHCQRHLPTRHLGIFTVRTDWSLEPQPAVQECVWVGELEQWSVPEEVSELNLYYFKICKILPHRTQFQFCVSHHRWIHRKSARLLMMNRVCFFTVGCT